MALCQCGRWNCLTCFDSGVAWSRRYPPGRDGERSSKSRRSATTGTSSPRERAGNARNPNRSGRLEHWDYDGQQIDGWDYDIGAQQVRIATAGNEAALLELIAAWALQPTDFTYPWVTADPK